MRPSVDPSYNAQHVPEHRHFEREWGAAYVFLVVVAFSIAVWFTTVRPYVREIEGRLDRIENTMITTTTAQSTP